MVLGQRFDSFYYQQRTVFQLANILESGGTVWTERFDHFLPETIQDLSVLSEHIDGVGQER